MQLWISAYIDDVGNRFLDCRAYLPAEAKQVSASDGNSAAPHCQPVMRNVMPNQTTANKIGRKGQRWFNSQLPDDWIMQLPTEDIGIDGNIVICEKGELNGTEFRVQIKSSSKFTRRDNQCVMSGIKKSSFLYWITGFTPTLIVLYEDKTNKGYFYWINELACRQQELLYSTSKTITLHIPMCLEINNDGWQRIRKDLKYHRNLVSDIFRKAGDFKILMPILNEIHHSLRGLISTQTAIPKDGKWTQEQENLIHLLEVVSHRDFVVAMEKFYKFLEPESEGENYIKRVVGGYKEICKSFVQNFYDILIDLNENTALWLNPALMRMERHKLMGLMVSILCTITQKPDRKTTS